MQARLCMPAIRPHAQPLFASHAATIAKLTSALISTREISAAQHAVATISQVAILHPTTTLLKNHAQVRAARGGRWPTRNRSASPTSRRRSSTRRVTTTKGPRQQRGQKKSMGIKWKYVAFLASFFGSAILPVVLWIVDHSGGSLGTGLTKAIGASTARMGLDARRPKYRLENSTRSTTPRVLLLVIISSRGHAGVTSGARAPRPFSVTRSSRCTSSRRVDDV